MLVFSRKWNLQRHERLMHGVNENTGMIDSALRVTYDNKPKADNLLSSFMEPIKPVLDFADMQKKLSHSIKTTDHYNVLSQQVSSLNQQLASCEKRFSDLLSNNLVLPKGAIQGISGHVCKICRTFSLKPVFDPGYDMSMQSKHRCADSPYKRSYLVFPIPSDIPDVDEWAAQTLLNQFNFFFPIVKYLVAKDITQGLINFSKKFNPEIARQILGIPDKNYCYSIENYSKASWINRAIDNLDKITAVTDDVALDFFRKVKSTYAIFDVPIDGTRKQFFMTFTNN
jgi:hypothetical protein